MSFVEAMHYHMIHFGEFNAAREMSANEFPRLLLVRPEEKSVTNRYERKLHF